MAEIIKMPKMSDTMEEGVIAVWHKKVGDQVESGELMAEIETDKATMDYESYNDGTVLYLGAEEGDAVKVDGILAIVGEKGEDYKDLLEGGSANGSTEQEEATEAAAEETSEEAIDTSGINAEIVRMPKMSDTMEEGVIAAWHKKVGDKVESGELVAEVETDKATMEYESYHDGTVLYIGAKEGESIKVDGILAVVGEEGADYEALIKADQQGGSAPKADAPAKEEDKESAPAKETAAPAATASNTTNNGRIKASPLAKRLAEEKGIDLGQVSGSGDAGRIVKRDIENFTPAAQPAAQSAAASGSTAAAPAVELPQIVAEESFEEVKVSQMRKTIAKRLAESKFTAPHFYLTMEINMDKAIEARKSMNEVSPVKISFNDMVIKAVAAALRKHPKVNSSWLGDKIRYNNHIHIGVAVAVDEGLLVPVVRFADNKTLSHISAEVKDLGAKAKNKELQPKDWEGNTFTISNLGMFGIEEFTAIVNPPDSCILAVGGIKQTPIVKDGQMVIGNIMKVTMSCDHRVVDGAIGSAFLQTFKQYLEDPIRILV
ncbi:pyruvate dehydrogenase complex dihydrolipoamide acetyltransferase [Roseivirga pacifica]|uniref:pyruvate dehydrogenase complex dihydrolipoamide acetyltransferase n=1 Tax=Roseivirga pacifica TaxID=1267423 RepID=UPI002095FB49|nr:pyruvate dehydrogenase complex dihydrolipoamide acetyltransferase [Roseivirga pacifica]MCO6357215.1 pyruvate dehydrogenase complex dihydrolipoamide acetyltransferase [Roseivirga pacifica]MCO6368071.1 pyruvate dehydrogenase complex dihydrolipoamide acetyltransferase [Roseivirga pacifica]MCO6369447.1 pyruvate dehydrogenase complex dihydrolipoamide acetyltransferase [Roseivirga pacifica]MCO6373301.1 pyruvate dehydrogenase complex dihydrolipoamide acetyltransferase [Roseivirga pacifica]MCO63774